MKDDTLMYLGLAAVAYYFYTQQTAVGSNFVTCRYPDGSTIQVPAGNQCPYDPTHGGQSMMCYPRTFVGPLPPGGGYC